MRARLIQKLYYKPQINTVWLLTWAKLWSCPYSSYPLSRLRKGAYPGSAVLFSSIPQFKFLSCRIPPNLRWTLYTQRCRAIHSYKELYTAIQVNTRVYTALWGYTQRYRAIHRYTGLHKAIHRHTELHRAIQGNTKLYRAMQSTTGLYFAKQKENAQSTRLF